jgi:DNA-directed RNA polymerase omega subunit
MIMPLEQLLDKARGSVYKTVILASKRALEIAEGQPSLIHAGVAVKPSTIALREIALGKCHVKK